LRLRVYNSATSSLGEEQSQEDPVLAWMLPTALGSGGVVVGVVGVVVVVVVATARSVVSSRLF